MHQFNGKCKSWQIHVICNTQSVGGLPSSRHFSNCYIARYVHEYKVPCRPVSVSR
jgi:hypothetical protein